MDLSLTLLQLFILLKELTSNNYLVGGCVRDELLGVQSKDYDVVTDAPIENIEGIFAKAGWDTKDTGKRFLVLNVSKNGEHYEIANFRKDGVYTDGRRPETTEIGTLHEDAKRRDFTVNALYLNPFDNELLDPLGSGLKDIEAKVLKFIGKPEDRINEDHLRIFRFYRFLTKGLIPDKKSLKACRTHFNKSYSLVDAERVRTEIERMVL